MIKSFKILMLLSIVFAGMFSSCKKKTEDDPAPAPITSLSGAITSGSYMPTNKATSWTYVSTVVGEYTGTMNGNTKVFEGITYKEMDVIYPANPSNNNVSYTAQVGNKYYMRNNESNVTLKMLDLDLPLGTSWTAGVIQTSTETEVKYVCSVKSVNASRNVNNKLYNNVLMVEFKTISGYTDSYIALLKSTGINKTVIDLMVSSANANAIVQNQYYALNVGLIEQTSKNTSLNMYLKNYTVK